MQENPYESIVNLMLHAGSTQNKTSLAIGKIIAEPPAIKVAYNGIILSSEDIFISDRLLREHEREARGKIVSKTQYKSGGSGDPAFASHNHEIDDDYTLNFITTDTDLKVGALVLIGIVYDSQHDVNKYVIIDHINKAR